MSSTFYNVIRPPLKFTITFLSLQTDLSNLTAEDFKNDVLNATLGGNADFPEATLDALMQAMVNNNLYIILARQGNR